MSPLEIRQKAKQVALTAVAAQMRDFRTWAIVGDWENAYRTLDPAFEARQLDVFAKMVDRALIYRSRKPVYWSPSARTALAESELEYRDDHQSRSVFVKFELVSKGGGKLPVNGRLYAVVWTTTPWTLPANKVGRRCTVPEHAMRSRSLRL